MFLKVFYTLITIFKSLNHRFKTLPNDHLCVCVCVCVRACARAPHLSRVQLFATPWTVACHAPLSMEFSRQEYWSGFAISFFGGDLPDPGIKLTALMSPAPLVL